MTWLVAVEAHVPLDWSPHGVPWLCIAAMNTRNQAHIRVKTGATQDEILLKSKQNNLRKTLLDSKLYAQVGSILLNFV